MKSEHAQLPNSILLADEFYRIHGSEDLDDSRKNFIRDLNAVVLSSYIYWTNTNKQPIQPNEVAYYMGSVFVNLIEQLQSYSDEQFIEKTKESLGNLTKSFEFGLKDKLELFGAKNEQDGDCNKENKV
jgi:hypothetical protein